MDVENHTKKDVMPVTPSRDHSHLLSLLQNGRRSDFEIIYNEYAERLYNFVYRRVKRKEVAEEIVQEIFISLWDKRNTLTVRTSLDAYLFTSARYSILSYMRSQRVRSAYVAHFNAFLTQRAARNSTEEIMDVKDLEYNIAASISKLPKKCRTAFHLSRIEQEPIPKIAERMNISTGTVENYLTQALKHLRTSLGDLLMLLLLLSSAVR